MRVCSSYDAGHGAATAASLCWFSGLPCVSYAVDCGSHELCGTIRRWGDQACGQIGWFMSALTSSQILNLRGNATPSKTCNGSDPGAARAQRQGANCICPAVPDGAHRVHPNFHYFLPKYQSSSSVRRAAGTSGTFTKPPLNCYRRPQMYSNRPQLFQMSFWTCRLSAGPAAKHSALDSRRHQRASAPDILVRGSQPAALSWLLLNF